MAAFCKHSHRPSGSIKTELINDAYRETERDDS
jgi:hypothetical protein